jgi:hypothetical protein
VDLSAVGSRNPFQDPATFEIGLADSSVSIFSSNVSERFAPNTVEPFALRAAEGEPGQISDLDSNTYLLVERRSGH